MAWKVAYKPLSKSPAEEILIESPTPWEAVETVRSQKAGDLEGKVIFIKAGE
ncbi:hypothetical protein [Frondihabitans cladoniiphilus]